MKKLYYCNATCDNERLYSYGLNVVKFITLGYGSLMVWVYRYPSMTTAQHLRKYAKWLEEQGEKDKSALLTACLDTAVKKKERYAQGYLTNCEITVEC